MALRVRSVPPVPLPSVYTLFLACALLGGAVVLIQLVLGVLGADHDLPGGDLHLDGLDLLSVRALSAGLTFFGVGGLLALQLGAFLPLALAVAAVAGTGATVGVALLLRALLRLESDGTVRIEGAVGEAGTVYLGIPGEGGGMGKVTLTLQGRTVECQAVAREPLPTGTPVVVVDVLGPDLVEVVPSPDIGDLLDARS